jgi:hypothetical protein
MAVKETPLHWEQVPPASSGRTHVDFQHDL